ncbi:MAG: hypothetical protein V3R46_02380, partial [Thermoplasmata archaeon]
DGPVKMTASTSRSGRMSAVLGILSAMVRGGRGKGVPRTGLAGGVALPRGVGVPTSQPIPLASGDLWLIR